MELLKFHSQQIHISVSTDPISRFLDKRKCLPFVSAMSDRLQFRRDVRVRFRSLSPVRVLSPNAISENTENNILFFF